MKPKLYLALTLFVIVSILILQNTEVVSYRFLVWELSLSRIILLPILFSFGLIIGFILGRRQDRSPKNSQSIMDT